MGCRRGVASCTQHRICRACMWGPVDARGDQARQRQATPLPSPTDSTLLAWPRALRGSAGQPPPPGRGWGCRPLRQVTPPPLPPHPPPHPLCAAVSVSFSILPSHCLSASLRPHRGVPCRQPNWKAGPGRNGPGRAGPGRIGLRATAQCCV